MECHFSSSMARASFVSYTFEQLSDKTIPRLIPPLFSYFPSEIMSTSIVYNGSMV